MALVKSIIGAASSITDTLLKKKGLKLDAKFDIRMPDTWTVMFDLSNPSDVAEKLRKADIEIALLLEDFMRKNIANILSSLRTVIASILLWYGH